MMINLNVQIKDIKYHNRKANHPISDKEVDLNKMHSNNCKIWQLEFHQVKEERYQQKLLQDQDQYTVVKRGLRKLEVH